MTVAGRLIRVFPRVTKATPRDDLARFGPPTLFDEADEVHVSVTFTQDKAIAEQMAEQWKYVAPVKIGGVAYGDTPLSLFQAATSNPGYTITSRGCPRLAAGFAAYGKNGPRPFRSRSMTAGTSLTTTCSPVLARTLRPFSAMLRR